MIIEGKTDAVRFNVFTYERVCPTGFNAMVKVVDGPGIGATVRADPR